MASNFSFNFSNNNNSGSSRFSIEIYNITIIGYVYLIPILSLIGFALNIPCLIGLAVAKLSPDSRKYLLLRTVTHLILLACLAFNALTNCLMCQARGTLPTQLINVYIIIFFYRAAFTTAALVEIIVSYQRLAIFKKRLDCLKKIRFNYMVILFMLLGLALNVPYLLAFQPAERPANSSLFDTVRTDFGNTSFYRIYIIALNLCQSFLSFILLTIFNVLATIEFKKYMKRKKNLTKGKNDRSTATEPQRKTIEMTSAANLANSTGKNKTERLASHTNSHATLNVTLKTSEKSVEVSFTMMIIVSSAFFTFTRLIQCFASLYAQLFPLIGIQMDSVFISYVNFLSQVITILYWDSNLFIYFIFNRMFREVFRKFFRQLV
jgi:hypothetical protein